MKKIPTLFMRSDDRRHVTSEVNPGCEWVLAGEGVATRKIDGTCVLIRRDGLAVKAYARREVKPGKNPPPGFIEVEHDAITGKTFGWEPSGQSGFAKLIDEAVSYVPGIAPGTYELIGPKVNGNPEGAVIHVLERHGAVVLDDAPRSFDDLRGYLLARPEMEGIVWHHADGRMAKIKRRDFA